MKAQAFIDPFTIAVAVQTVSSLISAKNKSEDAMETAMGIADLVLQIDEDPSLEKGAELAQKKIDELNSQVNQFQSLKTEMGASLNFDSFNEKSHLDKIHKLKEMIAMGKKIAFLFKGRPKGAERANQVEQTQISTLTLEEIIKLRQIEFQKHLESQEIIVKRKVILETLLDEESRESSRLVSEFDARRRK
jgi:hypothetical protein